MNEEPGAAAHDDFKWRHLGIVLLAFAVLTAWSVAQTRPTPGIKRAPAQAPAKQLPTQRVKPTGDPEPVCRGAEGRSSALG